MEDAEKKKFTMVIAVLKLPDGKEVEIPLPPKVFKTGREGFFAQISSFVYDEEVYSGQIQLWKKTPKTHDQVIYNSQFLFNLLFTFIRLIQQSIKSLILYFSDEFNLRTKNSGTSSFEISICFKSSNKIL